MLESDPTEPKPASDQATPGTDTPVADAPGNLSPEPPLTGWEKFSTGLLLITAICLPMLLIIAFWPDRLPTGKNTLYRCDLFHISLIDSEGDGNNVKNAHNRSGSTDGESATTSSALLKNVQDPIRRKGLLDSLKKDSSDKTVKLAAENKKNTKTDKQYAVAGSGVAYVKTIQLSTLILILVAAAGFLGNMVHIASSLTTYIGAGQFKRSWILWYWIKPFTASGLALFLYFALNGGNTGSQTAGNTVNLYVIMTTATLAGLFTDIATQKLKEVFAAIFKPSDNRPDKLTNQGVQVMSLNMDAVHPDKIDANQANIVLIPGQNLDAKNLVVKILGQPIPNPTITPDLIKFSYNVADSDKAKAKFNLKVTDSKGTVIGNKDWDVKS